LTFEKVEAVIGLLFKAYGLEEVAKIVMLRFPVQRTPRL
jgi:hypothetical protein